MQKLYTYISNIPGAFNLKVNGFLLYFLILIAPQAIAQKDSTHQLLEVQVKGTNFTHIQSITPSQTTTSSDFKKMSAYNVADAIRNFSGVNIKDYGGIGGMKTVSVRSLGANHTGVIYDGVPISDTQNGQIDLGKISLENVQNITLHNGQPGEILLPARSFSSASILSINSSAPRLDSLKPYALKAAMHTGSFGLFNPSLQWQQRLGKDWTFQMTNQYQKAHGRYKFKVDGDGSDTTATRKNANVNTLQSDAVLYWVRPELSKFQFRVNYYHSDRGLPGAVVFYNPYSNQHLWNRDLFIQSNYDQKWDKWRMLLNAKFTHNYTRYLDPDFLNSVGELDQRYHQKEFYAAGTIAFKPLEHMEVAYASDLSVSNLNTSMYGFVYPTRNTFLNAFSARYKLDHLEIQSTLLNSTIHETVKIGEAALAKSIWSPSFMASYQPFASPDWLLRAFYKDIFRNPTFNDLYYTRIGDRNLKPEYAKQWNVGITWSKNFSGLFDYLAITGDVYYNRVKDKIIAIPNKDLFSWTMVNLGKVEITGVDVSLKTKLSLSEQVKFTLSSNYTFQNAIDITDRKSSVYLAQIPYTPKHSMSMNAGFDLHQWGIYYNHSYSSHRYYMYENLPEYLVPGYFVSDLSTNYRFKLGSYPIITTAEINNLFNTSYAFIRSYPMPGRSLRLSIQITI
jgi:vitamin B12 transporter